MKHYYSLLKHQADSTNKIGLKISKIRTELL